MINPLQWLDFDNPKYTEIYKNRKLTHHFFRKWVKYHDKELDSALEIGGGKCDHMDLFRKYHCIEINQNCKAEYITNCDFIDYDVSEKFDLVFSHAVIDHVKNPNEFILKSIYQSKKWVFHSIYRGFTYNLKHGKPSLDKHGYIYNSLSFYELKEILEPYNHTLKRLTNGNLILVVKL